MTCIEDQRQLIPLNMVAITAKGKRLFAVLKEKPGTSYEIEFNDNSEWFKKFNNCYSLCNVRVVSL